MGAGSRRRVGLPEYGIRFSLSAQASCRHPAFSHPRYAGTSAQLGGLTSNTDMPIQKANSVDWRAALARPLGTNPYYW
jgi:hypothetical protein